MKLTLFAAAVVAVLGAMSASANEHEWQTLHVRTLDEALGLLTQWETARGEKLEDRDDLARLNLPIPDQTVMLVEPADSQRFASVGNLLKAAFNRTPVTVAGFLAWLSSSRICVTFELPYTEAAICIPPKDQAPARKAHS